MEDGVEIDLDFGYYECFICIKMIKCNNFIVGCVYVDVLCKECCGDYLGVMIQVIFYIINVIKDCVIVGLEGYDIVIVEVGGIVGDIELLLFMEVICQFVIEVGCEYVMFMYLMLVFYLVVVGEVKIKLI